MRYVPCNDFIVCNALELIGGSGTGTQLLDKIIEMGFLFTNETLSSYLSRLIKAGKINSQRVKGRKYNIHSLISQNILNVDPEIWIEVCYLTFKKGLSFNEVSEYLYISEEVVKNIYSQERLNNFLLRNNTL